MILSSSISIDPSVTSHTLLVAKLPFSDSSTVLNSNKQWLVRRLACRVRELEEMELHLSLET